MTTAYLNNEFVPLEEARISPMDRGFLFGDGIYEVIPSHGGRFVGLKLHLARLKRGLDEIQLELPVSNDELTSIMKMLVERNGSGSLGIYIQVTRGVSMTRNHVYPSDVTPTLFIYTFDIGKPNEGDPDTARLWRVVTGRDLRWQRCQIKSTSLLGNVMHMMEGVDAGAEEILLFDEHDNLTEASVSNAFVVSGNTIATPALDQHKLAGVTRDMALSILRDYGDFNVEVRPVKRPEVEAADELWLSSSTKELAPIVSLDGEPVGTGAAGPVWCRAQRLMAVHRFDDY